MEPSELAKHGLTKLTFYAVVDDLEHLKAYATLDGTTTTAEIAMAIKLYLLFRKSRAEYGGKPYIRKDREWSEVTDWIPRPLKEQR
jgi:hypothetical protein